MLPKKTFVVNIDWSMWVVETEQGTLLWRATLAGLIYDLDLFLWQQRTGVIIQMSDTVVVRMPWFKLFTDLKIDFSLPEKDRKRLFGWLEADCDTWLANRSTVVKPGEKPLDKKFSEETDALKRLHSIFSMCGNIIDYNILVGMFVMQLPPEVQKKWYLDRTKEQLRLYIQQALKNAFVTQGAPFQQVYRTQDEKKKPTNVVIPTPRVRGAAVSKDDKPVERYTAAIKNIGIAKADFEALVEAGGGSTTIRKVKDYQEKKDRDPGLTYVEEEEDYEGETEEETEEEVEAAPPAPRSSAKGLLRPVPLKSRR